MDENAAGAEVTVQGAPKILLLYYVDDQITGQNYGSAAAAEFGVQGVPRLIFASLF